MPAVKSEQGAAGAVRFLEAMALLEVLPDVYASILLADDWPDFQAAVEIKDGDYIGVVVTGLKATGFIVASTVDPGERWKPHRMTGREAAYAMNAARFSAGQNQLDPEGAKLSERWPQTARAVADQLREQARQCARRQMAQ